MDVRLLSCIIFVNNNILNYTSDELRMFIISTANPSITAVHSCIIKLHTCTAASRPRISASDFMVYCKAAQLTPYAAVSKIFIPSLLWNLQLIFTRFHHFKTTIILKIPISFITHLFVNIFENLWKTEWFIKQDW
jgi:hypothetical protein